MTLKGRGCAKFFGRAMASQLHNLSVDSEVATVRGTEAEGVGVLDIQAPVHGGVGSMAMVGNIYGTAWLQAMAVYYGVAFFLHFLVPAVTSPQRVQHGKIQSSADTKRDAMRALIPVCPTFQFLWIFSRISSGMSIFTAHRHLFA